VTTQVETHLEPTEALTAPTRIVGIGASAGGLESLEQVFANLPPGPGMAFVVVQHLSPDFRSVMDELLSRFSDMPVRLAEHGVEVRANHVYLLPPRKEITIQHGRLLLAEKDPAQGFTLPIDQFLASLAEDQGSRAVAIILSGTGSDGTRGIQMVKQAGGTVIVESPETAKFNGMPMSALATGLVDYVVEAREIPAVLTGTYRPPEDDSLVHETPLEVVFRLLRDQFGLDFSLYKTSTVSRRILRRVEMHSSSNLEEYVERLRIDSDELSLLYHDLLIGVTRFFRDPPAFHVLQTRAIPEILERVPPDQEIRVWVAGCATGEEAYSLAMILYEALTALDRQVNVKILATDVHRASLEHASAGIYGDEQLEFVSEERRERFFRRKGAGYQIIPDIRQLIVFAPQNLTKDAPFTKMHLITCRNVLIYFEPVAQKSVLSLFHFGLASNGLLFLGASESVGALGGEFEAIDEHWKIYRKKRDVRLHEPLHVPVLRQAPIVRNPVLGVGRTNLQDAQLLPTYDQLLDKFMPPSLLVDEDRNLLESFGGAERFLKLGRRRPTTNLLDLVEGDLRTVIAGAIQRALRSSGPFRYTGVPMPEEGRTRRWTLTAEPFANPRTGSIHVLLSFEAEDGVAHRAQAADGGDERVATFPDQHIQTLETELAYTRDTLQSTIEELQTSNEELQATNEELVAANEELQSTNEELHSVNEELYTVNAEYQKKIQELREVNGDMQHLLEGTDVGTLFLDRELRIRKYTPRVAHVFHIEPQDVGRELRHFSHGLLRPGLFAEVERTLRDGTVVEDEVRDEAGTTWFLRVLPYRPQPPADSSNQTTMQATGGVVISLTDISALERVRARVEQLSAIVESSNEAIIGRSLDGTITAWNAGAERLYGYTAAEAVGRRMQVMLPPGHADELEEFGELVRKGERVDHTETVRIRKDGTPVEVSVLLSPIYNRVGEVVGMSTIARDITPLKKTQQELALREERLRLILDSTAEAILGLSPDGRCTFCNAASARLLGLGSADDLVGQRVYDVLRLARPDGNPYPEHEAPILSVLRTGQGVHSDSDSLLRMSGSTFPAEYWSYPVWRDGRLDGAVVTFLDITDRKRAERELHAAARRREQFLAMLSHELRNPLAAVLAATQVMQAPAVEQRALGTAREVIERQSAHMARLLDDLLDVSRITRGGIELRKEDLDLREVTRTSLEAVGPLLGDRRSDLELDLPEEVVPVRGDPARLQQVVVNLLTNAARYSSAGSPIRLRIAGEGEKVHLVVYDKGCGLEPEMRTAIFELFVQAHQGLERSRGGLGVGLTLVKKIVELHGGTVEAQSDGVGKGCTFVVTLPLQRRAILHAPADPTRNVVPRRVVLVEDQIDARTMMRLLLESRGHVVLEVGDGAAAVEVIEREHPDVALVDIGLPIMSGYEVARKLRQVASVDDVLLVALTGYGTAEDVRLAYTAGFDAHLTKPADPDRIEQIIHRHRRQ
jgi:two-component system CheB/CheR fusion protein